MPGPLSRRIAEARQEDKDLEKRAEELEQGQRERLEKMTDEERAKYDIRPGESLDEKRARDERENPSK